MSAWSLGGELATRNLGLALTLACAACGDAASTAGANSANPAAHDAGDAFGNSAGNSAHDPSLSVIDDGGAGVLPDGAVVYLALWDRPCPAGSALTYEDFGQAFFQSYCLRCHSAQLAGKARGGAPASVNFDALEAIVTRKDMIWSVAADGNMLMPAAGAAPSSGERHLLGDWLACGAKSAVDATTH